jgi:hypothetical protein
MTTYSIGTTGYRAGPFAVKNQQIPDTNLSGNASATTGGVHMTIMRGDQVLVKEPDGSFKWYKFDSYRSTKDNPYLLKV